MGVTWFSWETEWGESVIADRYKGKLEKMTAS